MEFIVTTGYDIPNAKITKILGIARGSTVRTRNAVADTFAFVKKLIGGEVSEYTKLIADAREQAIQRMIEEAKKYGANAIIGVRFATANVMQGTAEILAYGTAVYVEKID
ncbi:MAG: YbjQ family protein [Candidatus Dojkabacteria bacterium]|nr:YbjQ family protein [Candidatus Dojkabacteria bacterium]